MPDEENIESIMEKKVVTVDLNSNVKNSADLMTKRKCGCLVVVKDSMAVGIVTERDLVTKIIADSLDPKKVLVRDIMSTPLITITPDKSLVDAARLMNQYQIRRIVVTEQDGSLVGIVTAGDLARTLAKKLSYADITLNAIARLKGSPSGGPYQ